ncbi:hypothetical protein [uncultured Roseobacter sp.]|uniref:hypothetical protein n=1 Tax=uncultured Roseobacter sp. TaxID=114847 RepID=UPI00261C6808|nr:hypothetical protein [uncultured Roseobacter sp.]
MSDNESNTDTHNSADTPVGGTADTSLEKRLSAARAKRSQVLSARAMAGATANSATAPDAAKGEAPPPVSPTPEQSPLPAPVQADADSAVRLRITGPAAVKALFIFSGSAGFGLGAVLGIGILIGAGQTVPAQQPLVIAQPLPAAQPAPVSLPEVSLAATDPALIEPEKLLPQSAQQDDPLSPAPVADAAPALTESPDSIQPAQTETPEGPAADVIPVLMYGLPAPEPVLPVTGPMPQISDIVYTSVDLAPDDAQQLRSLAAPDAATDQVWTPVAPPAFFIHAPDGLPQGRLRGYVAELEANGIEVAGIGREAFRVSTTHLRYYSAETADAAMALAEELGVPARDFSQNVQVPGRVEIWLAGRPKLVEPEPEPLPWWRRNREER